MARRLLAQRISTWPALAQRQALRGPEGQRGGDPALGERSIQGRQARRHRPSLDSVHRSAGVAPLLGTPQTLCRPPTAHPGAGAAGEGVTRIPREKGPWGGGNEGGRSAEPSGNRPRLFPGGWGGARGCGSKRRSAYPAGRDLPGHPIFSASERQRRLTRPCPGREAGKAVRDVGAPLRATLGPGSRPQPVPAPAAALCTQSHLGRSRPVGIGSEPWGTREQRPQRHGPLHSPVTAPGAEGGPPAAAGTLECERGTNASFHVGHSASGSQR